MGIRYFKFDFVKSNTFGANYFETPCIGLEN